MLQNPCGSLYLESEPPPPEGKVLGSKRLFNLLWGPPDTWASSSGGWGQSIGSSSSSSGATGGGRQGSGKAGSSVRIIPVE